MVKKVLFFIFILSMQNKSFFSQRCLPDDESQYVYSGVSVTCIYEKAIINLEHQHNSTVHVFRTNEQAYMAHWQH